MTLMTRSIFVQAFDEAENYIFCRMRKEIDHRRFLCFIFITIIELIVLPAYLLGQGGRLGWPFTLVAALQAAVFVVVEAGIWTKRMKMHAGLTILLGTIYIRQAIEVLLCSFWCPELHTTPMMIGNYVMGIASILFCIEAKLGTITLAMCAVSPVVFVVSALHFTDPDIISSLWYFLIVYSALVLLSVANYRQLYFERQWSDHVDNMSEEEMRSLDLLSEHPELSTDKTTSLLDRLDDKRRSHIINNVSQYVRDEYAGREAIASLSPELTESEIQICQLIMQGNSLKEICDIMKKGESNISSQRSHIRKKLGMQRDDNMRMFLEQKLYGSSSVRWGG